MSNNNIAFRPIRPNSANSAGAAGADTEIQYNSGGTFGASSAFTFNYNNNQLNIDGDIALSGVSFLGATSNLDGVRLGNQSTSLNRGISIGKNANYGSTGGTTFFGVFDQQPISIGYGANANQGFHGSLNGVAIGADSRSIGGGGVSIGSGANGSITANTSSSGQHIAIGSYVNRCVTSLSQSGTIGIGYRVVACDIAQISIGFSAGGYGWSCARDAISIGNLTNRVFNCAVNIQRSVTIGQSNDTYQADTINIGGSQNCTCGFRSINLGGRFNTVSSTRSTLINGYCAVITGTNYNNNTIVQNLSILDEPADVTSSSENNNILVWDSGTTNVKQIKQNDLLPALDVFYVDSNNPNDGNGSVVNPFKTLDLAYDAVIGTGTPNNPDFDDITIDVAGGVYSTALNLAINSVTWFFSEGARVTYTDDGYLFSNTGLTSNNSFLNVFGKGEFTTGSGGFIYVIGSNNNNVGKRVRFECESLRSTLNNVTDGDFKPLIICENPVGGLNGDSQLFSLLVKDRVASFTQKIFRSRNTPIFTINGSSKTVTFSMGSFGIQDAAPNAHIFDMGDTFGARICNLTLFAYLTDSYIKIGSSGSTAVIGRIEFTDIIVRSTRQESLAAQRFLQIGDFISDNSIVFTESRVMFRNIDYVEDNFVDTSNFIQYIGSGSTFDNLELSNSRLPYPIDPKIRLNKEIITTGQSPDNGIYNDISSDNTIGGRFNITNVLDSTGTTLLNIDENGFVGRFTGETGGGGGLTVAGATGDLQTNNGGGGLGSVTQNTFVKNTIAGATTGTITYDQNKTFGTRSSPLTGALTDSNTSAIRGTVQKIYHNAASLTLPTAWQLINGEYVGSTLNIIFVEYEDASWKEVTIVQVQ